MAKISVRETFVNRALVVMAMSAANTLTFQQVRFTTGLVEKIALLIHRVDWIPTGASLREMTGIADNMSMAITMSNAMTGLSPVDPRVLAVLELTSIAVAPTEPYLTPFYMDFSTLPGGGLLVPPNPLFLGMLTAGFGAAAAFNAVIYFSYRELSDADYLELIQTLLPQNI